MELTMDKLTKMYGKKLALDSFSYSFHEGIYGLLGPNGAGKSTLMGIVTTGLKATSGTVSFNGTDIAAMGKDYRALIGFMPQQQRIYEDFSLMRFLYYIAALKMSVKKTVQKVGQLIDIKEAYLVRNWY